MVPGDSTRPVMDRVKEALFSILGRSVVGSNFLDLYAGTGSVGIEALSRGAQYALFVEVDRLALKTIHENLALTKLSENAEVRRADVVALLKERPPRPFDFIYVAPPQFRDLWLRTLEALETNPLWVPSGTIVIVQIAPTEQTAVAFKHLKPYDERRYGRTLLWFFESVEEDE
jgi:16S rRNA (guanine(966)-N(2))-methyltransferase RsmD